MQKLIPGPNEGGVEICAKVSLLLVRLCDGLSAILSDDEVAMCVDAERQCSVRRAAD